MSAKILDGKIVRNVIADKLKEEITSLAVRPHLVIVQVGVLPESTAYIGQKKILGAKLGCEITHSIFPESIKEDVLIKEIKVLNERSNVHGIIVQLPLPGTISVSDVIEAIDPRKDVDGLTAYNLKLLWEGSEHGIVPATARGIVTLLDYYKIPIKGKHAVVIGRSRLVGKPTALALLNRDATVTICHKETKNIEEESKRADILVVAAGSPALVGKNYMHEGQTIVDVGITLTTDDVSNKKFAGDVKFDEAISIVHAITPVPGGVGPMTVISLFQNLFDACVSQTREQ